MGSRKTTRKRPGSEGSSELVCHDFVGSGERRPEGLNNLFTLRARDFFSIVEEMHRGHFGEWELMVILALMRLGDDAYGVPICREIEEQTGREVAVGSVYATLERLEEKGFVCSKKGEPTAERGGRAKRYFRMTGNGIREVRRTQRALMNLWNGLRQLEREMG